jgi:hypothetical protein
MAVQDKLFIKEFYSTILTFPYVIEFRVINFPTALNDQKGIIIELKAQLTYHTIYNASHVSSITHAPDTLILNILSINTVWRSL